MDNEALCRSGLRCQEFLGGHLCRTRLPCKAFDAKTLAKCFCRAKFWAKFLARRGQFGAKFLAKFAAKFFAKFSGLFCWDIQEQKNFSNNSAQNYHDFAQQNWRNFREYFHDEVLQGGPAISNETRYENRPATSPKNVKPRSAV